jgi:hypothetical protein
MRPIRRCTFFREKKLGYVFFANCDKGSLLNKQLERLLTEGAATVPVGRR